MLFPFSNPFFKMYFKFWPSLWNFSLSPSLSLSPTHSPPLPPPFPSLPLHRVSAVNEFVCECLFCCLFAAFESSETRWTGCHKVVKSLHSLTTCHCRSLSLNPICLRPMASCSVPKSLLCFQFNIPFYCLLRKPQTNFIFLVTWRSIHCRLRLTVYRQVCTSNIGLNSDKIAYFSILLVKMFPARLTCSNKRDLTGWYSGNISDSHSGSTLFELDL